MSAVCDGGCYGPETAPPPMLVIRIAIIRIAAAGVVRSRRNILEGCYRRAVRVSSILYQHMFMHGY